MLLVRLYARGLCKIDRFKLPLLHSELGQICEMSAIHANRMVAELREEGICTFIGGEVEVINLAQMLHVGHFPAQPLVL